MLVSELPGKEDPGQIILDRWDAFDLLSETEQKRLLASDVSFVIKSISDQYGISNNGAETISRMVRNIFLKKMSVEKAIDYLLTQIAGMTDENSRNIVNAIFSKIVNAEMLKEGFYEQLQAKNTHITIETALNKYPNIEEQLISSAPLKLRISPEPMRPTVKNWISDYHEQMGPGKHGTFDRGNYLFHSENTKALSSVERQKVSTILKSLDENTLLTIDPEKQEVVFEADSDSNLRIDTRIDKGFEQKSTNSGQGMVNYEQKRTENLQRSADNRQQIASNLQQAANSRQQSTSNRQQSSVAVDGMRIVKEAEKTLPAAGVAKPAQTQYQKPENTQPFKSQLVQGFGRTTAIPMDARRKMINPSESFGNYAIPEGDLVRKKPDVVKKEDNFPLRASYEAPRSPQVVEKKISTAPQNFGNDISGFQKQQPQPAKKIFSESSQGGQQQGKVSFSSPQQLPVEKKQTPAKRTPFRIVPHSDL